MISKNLDNSITDKIVIQLTFKNVSPLLIGGGLDNSSDLNIVRLSNGFPFIPGSSIAGCLLRCFQDNQDELDPGGISFRQFWGIDISENEKIQSHISIGPSTMTSGEYSTMVYDGVRIDPKTGTAADQAKYDYEYVNPGVEFRCEIVVTIRKQFEATDFKRLSYFVITCFENEFQIGAKANKGFGELDLSNAVTDVFKFPKDFDRWMQFCADGQITDARDLSKLMNPIEYKAISNLRIRINANLAGPIITALNIDGAGKVDKIQFHRESGKYIIPASSILGPISHRARKILNTVYMNQANSLSIHKNIFGDVEEETQISCRSKIIVKESEIRNSREHSQTRIQVDRFTGGVINSALAESLSIIPAGDKNVEFIIILKNPEPKEITLLMMVIKDLLTGDLAIGGEKGIGRGLFRGGEVSLEYNHDKLEETTFEINMNGDVTGNIGFINNYNSFME